METEILPTKGEKTRRSIEEAAYRLFIKQGYHATSMRQIADETGLALGGIYNHFSSKEEIFKALAVEMHPMHRILPIMIAAEGDNAEDFIRNAAQAMIAELERNPDFIKIMFIEILEFNAQHAPLVFESLMHQIQPLVERMTTMQDQLQAIPPPVIIRSFIGMFFSYYLTEIFIAEAMPAEMKKDALHHFVSIFLHGVLKEQP